MGEIINLQPEGQGLVERSLSDYSQNKGNIVVARMGQQTAMQGQALQGQIANRQLGMQERQADRQMGLQERGMTMAGKEAGLQRQHEMGMMKEQGMMQIQESEKGRDFQRQLVEMDQKFQTGRDKIMAEYELSRSGTFADQQAALEKRDLRLGEVRKEESKLGFFRQMLLLKASRSQANMLEKTRRAFTMSQLNTRDAHDRAVKVIETVRDNQVKASNDSVLPDGTSKDDFFVPFGKVGEMYGNTLNGRVKLQDGIKTFAPQEVTAASMAAKQAAKELRGRVLGNGLTVDATWRLVQAKYEVREYAGMRHVVTGLDGPQPDEFEKQAMFLSKRADMTGKMGSDLEIAGEMGGVWYDTSNAVYDKLAKLYETEAKQGEVAAEADWQNVLKEAGVGINLQNSGLPPATPTTAPSSATP